jgi:hypothetical protein
MSNVSSGGSLTSPLSLTVGGGTGSAALLKQVAGAPRGCHLHTWGPRSPAVFGRVCGMCAESVSDARHFERSLAAEIATVAVDRLLDLVMPRALPLLPW